jgi:hypothetical protein
VTGGGGGFNRRQNFLAPFGRNPPQWLALKLLFKIFRFHFVNL